VIDVYGLTTGLNLKSQDIIAYKSHYLNSRW